MTFLKFNIVGNLLNNFGSIFWGSEGLTVIVMYDKSPMLITLSRIVSTYVTISLKMCKIKLVEN